MFKSTLIIFFAIFLFFACSKKNKEVYLARDRHGEKPLYLLNLDNKLYAFAQQKQMIAPTKTNDLSNKRDPPTNDLSNK